MSGGYILAGGASSRMGADKAALRLGGATFVERVAAALRSITSEVFVVSSKHDAARWGLPVVPDLYENSGALGGLHAALTHANTRRGAEAGGRRIAVVSCDLPFVTGALMKRLASFCAPEWDAVAPVQEDGRAQPLCAVYESARCGPMADLLLDSGELRPRELLARVRTRWVAFGELAKLDGAALFFMNVNTPEEYERACEAAAHRENNPRI
ncbi:MAG TPA: molybdenum cofactor guanylyltransferase [Pyrinomonadaceae bacterium]